MDLARGGLCHCDFSWKPIPCAHRDCNIAIRYNSHDVSLGIYNRKNPAIAFQQDLYSRAQIRLQAAENGCFGHRILDLHRILLRFSLTNALPPSASSARPLSRGVFGDKR
jgi:hypothetical protein